MMKRKPLILVAVMVVAVAAALIVRSLLSTKDVDRLSNAEVLELREAYPIIKDGSALISTREITVAEIIPLAETFVYGRIKGTMKEYSEEVSSGLAPLDEKLAEAGSSNKQTYFSYTLEVINDTEGVFETGQEISLDSSSMFLDTIPDLENGMLMIVPVLDWRTAAHPDRYNFTKTGMYYVTEEQYTLSVFNESSDFSMSGNSLDATLDALRK